MGENDQGQKRPKQIIQGSLDKTFKPIPPKHRILSSFHGSVLIDCSVTTSSILWDSCHIGSSGKASLVAHYKDNCRSGKFVTWATQREYLAPKAEAWISL